MHLSKEAIGSRLQEERKRIGLNQDDFSRRIGVAKRTLAGYESGTGEVGALALALASELGVDVLFVVTGERKATGESVLVTDELELVMNYRRLADADRTGTAKMVTALAEMAYRDEAKKKG